MNSHFGYWVNPVTDEGTEAQTGRSGSLLAVQPQSSCYREWGAQRLGPGARQPGFEARLSRFLAACP